MLDSCPVLRRSGEGEAACAITGQTRRYVDAPVFWRKMQDVAFRFTNVVGGYVCFNRYGHG